MPRTPRRVSVVNHKGGVGKTTTAINLAAGLGARGARVLLADWDPQGNATQFLGFAHLVGQEGVYGSADFALGTTPFDPQRSVLPNVDLLPGTEELAFVEERLLGEVASGSLYRLASALEQVSRDYDYVITDCAPTIGMMALTAIVACPEVLIPVELEFGSIPGVLRLRDNIEKLRATTDPSIRVLGVLGTKYHEPARTPAEVLARLREIFGDAVFDVAIHRAQAVADAAGSGKPVVLASPHARGAVQYDLLTAEVIARG